MKLLKVVATMHLSSGQFDALDGLDVWTPRGTEKSRGKLKAFVQDALSAACRGAVASSVELVSPQHLSEAEHETFGKLLEAAHFPGETAENEARGAAPAAAPAAAAARAEWALKKLLGEVDLALEAQFLITQRLVFQRLVFARQCQNLSECVRKCQKV